MSKVIELRVNGKEHRIEADPARSLLSVLRGELSLTGSKYGCGEAQCGACTVMIEGRPRRSCVIPVPDLKATNSFSRISDSGDLLRISSRLIQIWYHTGGGGCGKAGDDHRRLREERTTASASGSVSGEGCHAMWLLHGGHDYVRGGFA